MPALIIILTLLTGGFFLGQWYFPKKITEAKERDASVTNSIGLRIRCDPTTGLRWVENRAHAVLFSHAGHWSQEIDADGKPAVCSARQMEASKKRWNTN